MIIYSSFHIKEVIVIWIFLTYVCINEKDSVLMIPSHLTHLLVNSITLYLLAFGNLSKSSYSQQNLWNLRFS